MDYAGAIEHILKELESDLPQHLHYHGHHHTLDVLEAVERIGKSEGVSEDQLRLLHVAAAYHDCGFLNGHKDHELTGCQIAKKRLPEFGFKTEAINQICDMIMATKVPQDPQDHLAQILCDADLDYLGRDDFEPIGSNLFKELEHLDIITDIKAWNKIQLSFLTQHEYHTAYGKSVRQPAKQKHLEKIRTVVSSYED